MASFELEPRRPPAITCCCSVASAGAMLHPGDSSSVSLSTCNQTVVSLAASQLDLQVDHRIRPCGVGGRPEHQQGGEHAPSATEGTRVKRRTRVRNLLPRHRGSSAGRRACLSWGACLWVRSRPGPWLLGAERLYLHVRARWPMYTSSMRPCEPPPGVGPVPARAAEYLRSTARFRHARSGRGASGAVRRESRATAGRAARPRRGPSRIRELGVAPRGASRRVTSNSCSRFAALPTATRTNSSSRSVCGARPCVEISS